MSYILVLICVYVILFDCSIVYMSFFMYSNPTGTKVQLAGLLGGWLQLVLYTHSWCWVVLGLVILYIYLINHDYYCSFVPSHRITHCSRAEKTPRHGHRDPSIAALVAGPKEVLIQNPEEIDQYWVWDFIHAVVGSRDDNDVTIIVHVDSCKPLTILCIDNRSHTCW